MNSIKFLVGLAVTGLTLAGFIVMDPSFKSSLEITSETPCQRISPAPERLNVANNTAGTDIVVY